MSSVKYSIPEQVKAAFNAAFAGRNKSAIVAELMRAAIERKALVFAASRPLRVSSRAGPRRRFAARQR